MIRHGARSSFYCPASGTITWAWLTISIKPGTFSKKRWTDVRACSGRTWEWIYGKLLMRGDLVGRRRAPRESTLRKCWAEGPIKPNHRTKDGYTKRSVHTHSSIQ